MSEKVDAPAADEVSADLRGTLTRRLVVAAVLVAVLLAILAFFDYLATPTEESEATVFTQPVPVAPKKEVSQPLTTTESLPEPPAPAAEPDKAEAPVAARGEVPPAIAETPGAAPSLAPRDAVAPQKLQAKPPGTPVPVAVPATPEGTAPPGVAVSETVPTAPVAKPNARQLDVRPVPLVVPPGAAARGPGFVLQAGVFSSAQRAEELHAKLTLSGVPSVLETRVQVGPFRSRQEAEAAQAKLRELGVETILVPPKGGR